MLGPGLVAFRFGLTFGLLLLTGFEELRAVVLALFLVGVHRFLVIVQSLKVRIARALRFLWCGWLGLGRGGGRFRVARTLPASGFITLVNFQLGFEGNVFPFDALALFTEIGKIALLGCLRLRFCFGPGA